MYISNNKHVTMYWQGLCVFVSMTMCVDVDMAVLTAVCAVCIHDDVCRCGGGCADSRVCCVYP